MSGRMRRQQGRGQQPRRQGYRQASPALMQAAGFQISRHGVESACKWGKLAVALTPARSFVGMTPAPTFTAKVLQRPFRYCCKLHAAA